MQGLVTIALIMVPLLLGTAYGTVYFFDALLYMYGGGLGGFILAFPTYFAVILAIAMAMKIAGTEE